MADDADPSLEIPREYKVQLDQSYINSRTGETLEGEITVPSRTGLILLISGS